RPRPCSRDFTFLSLALSVAVMPGWHPVSAAWSLRPLPSRCLPARDCSKTPASLTRPVEAGGGSEARERALQVLQPRRGRPGGGLMRVAILTDNDFRKVNGVTTTLRALVGHAPPDIQPRVYTMSEFGEERPEYLALASAGIPIPYYGEMQIYWPRVG